MLLTGFPFIPVLCWCFDFQVNRVASEYMRLHNEMLNQGNRAPVFGQADPRLNRCEVFENWVLSKVFAEKLVS